MKRWKKVVAVSATGILAVGLFPLAANAQFGGVVIDPTAISHLIQQFNQMVKTYQLQMQTYQEAKAMAQMIANPQRVSMLALGPSMLNNYTQSRYGETVNWSAAMNGARQLSSGAWNRSTVAVGVNPYLAAEKLGNSVLLAHMASIEATDGASQKCMQRLAETQSNQGANRVPDGLLKQWGLDSSTQTDAVVAQLNIANSSNQQSRAAADTQSAIQSCLAEEQVLSMKQRRDEQAEELNMYGDFVAASQSQYAGMAPMGQQNAGWLIP